MTKTCDRCGEPLTGGVIMGGAHVCAGCAVGLEAEIHETRRAGKKVSALQMARSYRRSLAGPSTTKIHITIGDEALQIVRAIMADEHRRTVSDAIESIIMRHNRGGN